MGEGGGNSLPGYQSIMAIIRYNVRFVITAKSLGTNVAVVTRDDCMYISNVKNSVISYMKS